MLLHDLIPLPHPIEAESNATATLRCGEVLAFLRILIRAPSLNHCPAQISDANPCFGALRVSSHGDPGNKRRRCTRPRNSQRLLSARSGYVQQRPMLIDNV